MAFGQRAVKVVDLGCLQIARLRFEEHEMVLEVADPPGSEGQPMQWLIISGRGVLTTLAHSILEFSMDFPERDIEELVTEIGGAEGKKIT